MNHFSSSTIYQIYTKSFCDSDGDGRGDIRGVTGKLDYLRELGVDYIWLTPFFKSPQKDNGYDVADYTSVDPAFGTMDDVKELIREADRRGIGCMFDMVFNHTSTEHRWFKRAMAGEAEYMDYYIFRDGSPDCPPTNWQSKFGGSAWEYVPELGKYYLHLFDRTQADLNWDNPKVRKEIQKILLFWKKKGIRGFRFDVINLISKPEFFEDDDEGDGRRFYTDGPRVHEYLREMVRDTGLYEDDIITVGEMSSTTIHHCIQYTNPKEQQLKMCFNFHHLKVDYKDGDKWSLMPYDFRALKKIFHTWQTGMAEGNGWNAVFWCNHDQPRAVSRFGDDGRYRKQSAKMLATAIHGMRGTPYIYQGEEIGMTNANFVSKDQYRDVESLNHFDILKEKGVPEDEIYEILRQRSRDNGRTPMQWDGGINAGFTGGTPWIGINGNYGEINVRESLADENSIFHYYQKLVRLRKERPVISEGDYEPVLERHEGILGYRRTYEGETLIVLANFTDREQTAAAGEAGMPKDFTGYEVLIANDGLCQEENLVRLAPYGAVMLWKQN